MDAGERLEHAPSFLPQLELARATSWKCRCGCASIDFLIEGQPEPTGGMNILSDFLFNSDDVLSGIILFAQSGILSGIEVYGLSGEVPQSLPTPEQLRPFSTGSTSLPKAEL